MDLKAEFKKMLIEHGHLVYLITQGQARCSCFTYPAQKPRQDCPICFGTGYRSEIHRVLTYSRGSSANPSQPTNFRPETPGFHDVAPQLYYLDTEPAVKSGDLIVEPERHGNRFLGIRKLYRISNPYLYRMEDAGKNARPIYYRVGAVRQPSRRAAVENAIRERFRKGDAG